VGGAEVDYCAGCGAGFAEGVDFFAHFGWWLMICLVCGLWEERRNRWSFLWKGDRFYIEGIKEGMNVIEVGR
jgi:hypothetical protein